jgi:hypothetical protein
MEGTRTTLSCRRVALGILVSGLNDDISASEVASGAINVGYTETAEDIRLCSVGAVEYLLQHQFVEIGSFVEPPRPQISYPPVFTPWKLSVREALDSVDREWQDLGTKFPTPGLLFWLRNTALGNLVAKWLLTEVLKVRSVADEILVRATEQPLDARRLRLVVQYRASLFLKEDKTLAESLRALRQLMTNGFVEIGSLSQKPGCGAEEGECAQFSAWTVSMPEALSRVEAEWRQRLAQGLKLHGLFWLRNTALGNEVAQALLDKEERVWQEAR